VFLAMPPSFLSNGMPQAALTVQEYFQGNTFSARGLDYGLIEWDQAQDKAFVTYK
jgi:hypothetical protein